MKLKLWLETKENIFFVVNYKAIGECIALGEGKQRLERRKGRL